MICLKCNEPKTESDFIKNQEFCYKCEYRIKLKKIQSLETPKKRICRFCSKEIIHKRNWKKRQRTIYCSQECAEEGHKKLIYSHWTRHIKTEGTISWKINHS